MTDDVVYDLIQHCSLADVLAFINAREDVRAMCSAQVADVEAPPSSYADTVPLPSSTTAPPAAAPSTLRQGSR